MRQRPTLATTLLEYFATPSVCGDLLESFQDGQSRWWFWRQAAGSIGAQMFADFRAHPVLMTRAIVVGVSFTWAFARFALFDLLHYDHLLFSTGLIRWFYLNGYGFPEWSVWPATALLIAASGWIAARTHPQLRPTLVLAYALIVVCLTFGFDVWRLFHPLRPGLPVYLIGVRESVPFAIAALVGGIVGLKHPRRSERVYD